MTSPVKSGSVSKWCDVGRMGLSTDSLAAKHAALQHVRLGIWLQVRVTVPEIAVSMDAQEFQILQDVASHLAAEQAGLLTAQPQCLQISLLCCSQARLPFSCCCARCFMSECGCQRHPDAPLQLSAMSLQVPTVIGIGQDAALLYEAESEEVVIARDTFASLRQYLVTLQDEVSPAHFLLVDTPRCSVQEHKSAWHQAERPLKQWVAVAAWP